MSLPILFVALLGTWTIIGPVALFVIVAMDLQQRLPDWSFVLIGGPIVWYLRLAIALRDRRLERERIARSLARSRPLG